MQYLDPLDLRFIGPGQFQHLREFRCLPEDGSMLTVPAGRFTDGASTPKIIWPVMSPWGSWTPAAALHDWLYREAIVPRDRADALFLEGMLSSGTDPAVARTMYRGVRLFGSRSYQG